MLRHTSPEDGLLPFRFPVKLSKFTPFGRIQFKALRTYGDLCPQLGKALSINFHSHLVFNAKPATKSTLSFFVGGAVYCENPTYFWEHHLGASQIVDPFALVSRGIARKLSQAPRVLDLEISQLESGGNKV